LAWGLLLVFCLAYRDTKHDISPSWWLLVCVLQETYQLCVSLPFRFYHVENACILL
jgi:hypothetical protein